MPEFLRLDDVVQPAAVLFGMRLKARRTALNLTQSQLSERTAIGTAYISAIERAQANPTLDVMVKLAAAVGLEAWVMIRPGPGAGG